MTYRSCRTIEIVEAALGRPPLEVRYGRSAHTHYALSHWRYFIGSYPVEAMPSPVLVLHLGGKPKTRLLNADKSWSTTYSVPGDVAFVPAHTSSSWLIDGEIEILLLALMDEQGDEHPSHGGFADAPAFKEDAALGVKAPLTGELLRTLWAALPAEAASENATVNGTYAQNTLTFLEQHLHQPSATAQAGFVPNHTATVGPARQMHDLMLYIQQHYAEDLSINALAEQSEMAPSYLSQSFRKVAGISPHRYILARRVEAARSMLESTTLPISTIAHETGFSSQSHLTTAFSKLMEMTPGNYRKRIRDMQDT